MSEPERPFPYQSDLGMSGVNPLFELAGRLKPVQDAWGYTLRQLATLHVGPMRASGCWPGRNDPFWCSGRLATPARPPLC
jgi:hypothetical protein